MHARLGTLSDAAYFLKFHVQHHLGRDELVLSNAIRSAKVRDVSQTKIRNLKTSVVKERKHRKSRPPSAQLSELCSSLNGLEKNEITASAGSKSSIPTKQQV